MAVAFVGSEIANGSSGGTSSPAIDTSGANFLVCVTGANFGSTPTVSDSKANTWTALTFDAHGTVPIRLLYVPGATVGSGHTFTISGDQCAGVFAAFSGVDTASPFDQQTSDGGGGTPPGDTFGPGSITPPVNGCLMIAGVANGRDETPTVTGYTVIFQPLVGGSNFAAGLAYQIQTTATATNPPWNFGIGDWTGNIILASFEPGVAAAFGPPELQPKSVRNVYRM